MRAWAILSCSLALAGCGMFSAADPPAAPITSGLPIPDSLKGCPDGAAPPAPLPAVRTVDQLLAKLKEWQAAYASKAKARDACDRDRAGAVRWADANTVLPGKLAVPLLLPQAESTP